MKILILVLNLLTISAAWAATFSAKDAKFQSFADEPLAKTFSGNAEGGFVLAAGEDKEIKVIVYKRELPKTWRSTQDLRQWKVLLSDFFKDKKPRTILKDTVKKNGSDFAYTYELTYMPEVNTLHKAMGRLLIKDGWAYLVVYDRNMADYNKELAAAKGILQTVKIE